MWDFIASKFWRRLQRMKRKSVALLLTAAMACQPVLVSAEEFVSQDEFTADIETAQEEEPVQNEEPKETQDDVWDISDEQTETAVTGFENEPEDDSDVFTDSNPDIDSDGWYDGTVAAVGDGGENIPSDALYYNGHYYAVFNLHSGWNEAKSYCESLGGYLATITSQGENDAVFAYMLDQGYDSAYFGLTDKETEGTWKWVTGEKVDYTNWHPGEPNSENSNEDYGMFYYKFPDGTWNDGDFGGSTVGKDRAFLCEWGTYTKAEERIVNIATDTWSFPNFTGCKKKYWQLWYPEMQAKELSKWVKAANGGVCYGMVMSAMTLNSADQSASDFSSKLVSDIKQTDISKSLDISATDYIRYMFPLQISTLVQNSYSSDLNGLYRAVKAFENGENDGVEIGVFGKYWFENHAGHSLWGIKTVDEENYSKILVYDCNHPKEERYIILNKDSNGNFVSWSYDTGLFGAATFGTGQKGEPKIDYIDWDGTFYEQLKAKLLGMDSILPPGFTDRNLVALSSGTLTSEGATKIELSGLIEQSEEEAKKLTDSDTFYWNTNDSVQITGNDNGLDANFIGSDSSVEITSSKGKSATLTLSSNNSFQLKTESGDSIRAVFSSLEKEGTTVQTQIEGSPDQEVITASDTKNGNTIINGFNNISVEITKEVENSDGSTTVNKEKELSVDNLNPDHDYNVSTKTADNEAKIVVSEDTNGDGTFDTEIASTDGPIEKEHKWSEWKIIKQPTALAKGSRQRTCSVCNKVATQSIAKLKATIKLNVSSVKLKIKQSTSKIKVTGLAKGDAVKSWKSSNTKIVKVNRKGKITAQSKKGKATVTVTLKSGLSRKITVVVQKNAVACTGITLNKSSLTMKKGKSFILKHTIKPITCVQKVKYTSSNKKVAKVSSKGKITAVKKGTATITVAVGKKKVRCIVRVK